MQDQEIQFKKHNSDNGLEKTGDILILVGAILATIIHSFLIILSAFLLFLWFIPGATIITLVWITRFMSKKTNSLAWLCFGLLLGFFTGEFLTLIGYICKLIAANQNTKFKA